MTALRQGEFGTGSFFLISRPSEKSSGCVKYNCGMTLPLLLLETGAFCVYHLGLRCQVPIYESSQAGRFGDRYLFRYLRKVQVITPALASTIMAMAMRITPFIGELFVSDLAAGLNFLRMSCRFFSLRESVIL